MSAHHGPRLFHISNLAAEITDRKVENANRNRQQYRGTKRDLTNAIRTALLHPGVRSFAEVLRHLLEPCSVTRLEMQMRDRDCA